MTLLDRIVEDKRAEVAAGRALTPRAVLERRCATLGPARDFEAALRPAPGGVGLIAEVKRASPSRGVLSADLDPAVLAAGYARHGADAISVLTDAKYFRGSLDDLRAVRAAARVPLLRKDFTLDEWQLWESREAGADAVLLIVAILERALLRDLLAAAKGLGLAALVECHTGAEIDTALAAGARVLGINNRDLRTFETRLETTLELMPLIPPGPLVVSESGFFSGGDVRRVVAAGAHAVLVGEALVRAADVGGKILELRLTGGAVSRDPGGQMGGASSLPARPGGEMGGASSLPARPGGEMGGASRPTHSE